MSEYDSPWKEALDRFFPLFIAFFFPDIYADIDWSVDYEGQDSELHKLAPEGAIGKRLADNLVKVRRKSGDDAMLHVELQVQKDEDMPRRTYTYQYRGSDRYNMPVVSLVILGDADPDWRPDTYVFSLWGCTTTFCYRVVKLLDWRDRLDELEAHENPIGLLVWAHLQAQRTHNDPVERQRCKSRLVRGVAERGMDKEDVRQWYRVFDWLLNLPQEYEHAMWEEIRREEKEKLVQFVTFAEQYGMTKGMGQGLLQGLEILLRVKFGSEGTQLMPILREQTDVQVLQRILTAAETATNTDELRRLLPAINGGDPTSGSTQEAGHQ